MGRKWLQGEVKWQAPPMIKSSCSALGPISRTAYWQSHLCLESRFAATGEKAKELCLHVDDHIKWYIDISMLTSQGI